MVANVQVYAEPEGQRRRTSRLVILKSADEESFELLECAARISELVRDSLSDDEDDDDDDDGCDDCYDLPAGTPSRAKEPREVQVLRVDGNCLRKVVEFMKRHDEEPMQEIATPLEGSTFEEVMKQDWCRNFVAEENLDDDTLFDLLTAANYMGIKPLLDLACLKITFKLNGKDAEEIRQILNLPKMTPEEEARAREEHRWIFEDSYT